ncbi:hypothetical protein L249_4409 [Ophiocordyceps polyrhachis-furcata BCC 54312]|uniref:TOG domain-containing protein n=1 Tax=Ophiocordyceps polyrhachis-furcata BCC 54312 TaxID=1330021 RepID=A0A367L845_9HYPO|nr:hypothetical protein L249_4409 [Ophiocordyceps polyrhachis-furcata BCC 54312]
MAETKLTDQQVTDLVALLRGDSSFDIKVQHVTAVKSGIKQHNVPEASAALLFDALRIASASQHAALVNAGFTALNHLLTRLSRQEPRLLAKEAPRTLPVIVDRLGDHKDKFRALASQALSTLSAVAPIDVERAVRNQAMVGKNSRAKEAAMQWLLQRVKETDAYVAAQMHHEQGLQFRAYVPTLMELLEDADGAVRDAAKSTVIELFKTAPNAAKSDLKRQLKNFKVRPAIEQAIVKTLGPTGRPDTPSEAAPQSRSNLGASVSSLVSERATTPMAEAQTEAIEPMYVNTHRELDDLFRGMASHFEGKETEQNWMKREQAMSTLRKLNTGNAPADFSDSFLAGLRGMLDGIIKAVNSLRTSLSKEGCSLVQDIANTLGSAIDPMVELLMQTLVKLSAGTKKISSQLANVTVDTIIARVSYSGRLMQHVWGACQDKNVQPRLYATGWLKTLLKKEAHHKSHVEHTGGVELMEKCIKKGLGDANPGVREKMRSTYWAFWAFWPARADAIMADLDPTAQKLLSKDPSNPNSPKKTAESSRPGLGFSKSTTAAGKPSVREAMMAQRKANTAAKNLPPRPGSAMAHISPVRSTSNSLAKPAAATRTRQEPTISVNAGGMSVAPMRPARRRPDMVRPATAGPYSVRDQPGPVDVASPDSANVTPKPKSSTPRRTVQRPRLGIAPSTGESSPTVRSASRIPSPRGSPPTRLARSATTVSPVSPKAYEDMTLVVPSIASALTRAREEVPEAAKDMSPPPPPPETHTPAKETTEPQMVSSAKEKPSQETVPSPPASETPSRTLKVFEDPFREDDSPQKPTLSLPVLGDKPINEDAQANGTSTESPEPSSSPEKARQKSRLLDSGINKIKAKTLEVHGFRKLQSLIRDPKTALPEDKLEPLAIGLFRYLEDPLENLPADKAQDVKAQMLATMKLLLKREREAFRPFVAQGLESLLVARGCYDGKAHVVSGLELLADDLVLLGDGPELMARLGRRLQTCDDTSTTSCRSLSMGLHVVRSLVEKSTSLKAETQEDDDEQAEGGGLEEMMITLARRTLSSPDSGVRMEAVKLCVALHRCLGDAPFWAAVEGIADDPKSLITYYIVKREREQRS